MNMLEASWTEADALELDEFEVKVQKQVTAAAQK